MSYSWPVWAVIVLQERQLWSLTQGGCFKPECYIISGP